MKHAAVKSAQNDIISIDDYDKIVRVGTIDEYKVYWSPFDNVVLHINSDTGEVTAEKKLSRMTVGEYILDSESEGGCWKLNGLGDFLRSTGEFYGSRILTVQQEEAFGLYRFGGFEVEELSEVLGISESSVETRLSNTQKKISCAFNLVESIST